MQENLDPTISRRAALTAAAAIGAAATLAACSSGGGTGGDAGGNGASGGPSAAAGEVVIELSKVPIGSASTAKLADGSGVFVSRPTAKTANCFSRTCTHLGCTVNPPTAGDAKKLHCPCHGSVYSALTGAVIHGPAPKALPTVPVSVQDGKVVTS